MKYKFNAKLVKTLRGKRGWTQKQLATRAKMTVAGVSMIENAGRAPSIATFCKLCKVLETSPTKFLT